MPNGVSLKLGVEASYEKFSIFSLRFSSIDYLLTHFKISAKLLAEKCLCVMHSKLKCCLFKNF